MFLTFEQKGIILSKETEKIFIALNFDGEVYSFLRKTVKKTLKNAFSILIYLKKNQILGRQSFC